jgi:hypothetical protein
VVVPLKIETGSHGTVAAFFPNAEAQRNNLRRNAIPEVVRSPWLISKASSAILFRAVLPDVEERPGHSEKTTGLTDIAAHSLRMLQRISHLSGMSINSYRALIFFRVLVSSSEGSCEIAIVLPRDSE